MRAALKDQKEEVVLAFLSLFNWLVSPLQKLKSSWSITFKWQSHARYDIFD